MGFTTKVSSGKDKRGRERMHTVCGLLMHSSLAATTDGLPLGMAAVKFDERGEETERCRMASATAPLLDSTHDLFDETHAASADGAEAESLDCDCTD